MNHQTYTIQNRHTQQQTEDITLTLTQIDKVNNIWDDKYGIEYLQVLENRFDRITPKEPYTCKDPLLDEISVATRQNCHFRESALLWK